MSKRTKWWFRVQTRTLHPSRTSYGPWTTVAKCKDAKAALGLLRGYQKEDFASAVRVLKPEHDLVELTDNQVEKLAEEER